MFRQNSRPGCLLPTLAAGVLLLTWMLLYQFRLNLANTWMVRSQLEQSQSLSLQARTWLEQLSAAPLAAQADRSSMKLAVLEGRMQDAVEAGERALALQPSSDPITSHFLGLAYWGLGRKDEARSIWQASGNLPHYLDRLAMQGWENFAAGHSEQAVALFQRGIDYDPSWLLGYSALANYYWQRDEVAQATPYLERLVSLLAPDDSQRTFAQARLALASGDTGRAKALFCQAWESEARSEYLHGCLWGVKQLGDAAGALKVLRSAAAMFPAQVATEAQSWSDQLLQSGDPGAAAPFRELACSLSQQPAGDCH